MLCVWKLDFDYVQMFNMCLFNKNNEVIYTLFELFYDHIVLTYLELILWTSTELVPCTMTLNNNIIYSNMKINLTSWKTTKCLYNHCLCMNLPNLQIKEN